MKKKLIGVVSILLVGSLCLAGNAFAVKDDGVTSEKIKEADNTSGQDTNSGSGVKTGHIADGAVTDAKINDVSMGKVTGLQGALDSKADTGHGHVYSNMTVVANSGGEYANPAMAMNDLANWCGSPSINNRCTVLIMPGRYDISSTGSINMAPFVSLIGNSPENTIILAEGIDAIAGDSAGVSIENLTIQASEYGLYLDIASAPLGVTSGMTLKNTKILFTNKGNLIRNNEGKVTVDNCELSGGIFVQGNYQAPGSGVEIKNTTITTTVNPESAISAGYSGDVRLSNVNIKGGFWENFQIHNVNRIMVDNLVGVFRVNSGANQVYIRDSILGDPSIDKDVWLDQRSNGSMKVINSMMVNGANGVHTYPNHGPITLLNCYDHNLNPANLLPAP